MWIFSSQQDLTGRKEKKEKEVKKVTDISLLSMIFLLLGSIHYSKITCVGGGESFALKDILHFGKRLTVPSLEKACAWWISTR